ncbi:MAG: ribonuclease PH, partial [Nitrospiraceae bacterium]|nr:ribonuclease PH [Nitrospiraceae bacterium]
DGVLTAEESLPVSPIVGQCAAVSVGLVDGRVLLDLCYEEDFRADVDMNLVMLADGGIVEIQGCAEGAAFPRARMDEMMDVATTGINDLLAIQNEALGRG